MLIRIKDGLIVDHTEIRLVKKETTNGGTKETLEVVFRHPVTGFGVSETLYEKADVDRVYNKIVCHI